MATKLRKLIITWGLPGSGKTTFCKLQVCYPYSKKSSAMASHDDFDTYRENKDMVFLERAKSLIASAYDDVLLDTLITTNQGFANFFKLLDFKSTNYEIEIQYWDENRDACVWNDKYRRSVHSEITIHNMVYERPDIKVIKSLYPNLFDVSIQIIRNIVVRKAGWKMFADKYNIYHTNGVIKSDTWSLGGTSGSCWGDGLSSISPGTPLSTFKEFDDLMEKVCPNISFMVYKRIYNNCVSTDTESDCDYYGGSVNYGFFTCSLPSLYDELTNANLITLDEL